MILDMSWFVSCSGNKYVIQPIGMDYKWIDCMHLDIHDNFYEGQRMGFVRWWILLYCLIYYVQWMFLFHTFQLQMKLSLKNNDYYMHCIMEQIHPCYFCISCCWRVLHVILHQYRINSMLMLNAETICLCVTGNNLISSTKQHMTSPNPEWWWWACTSVHTAFFFTSENSGHAALV